MRNRAIKISVSMPINLLEKLDKITTYRGKSRSAYICGAVTQRIEARRTDNMDDWPFSALLSMLHIHEDTPQYMKAILEHAMSEIHESKV